MQNVPETHVPHEFADWGIIIQDWATVSSLKARNGENPALLLLTKFMLPTVGCEADAASFVEEKRLYSTQGEQVAAADEEFSHNGPTGKLQMNPAWEHFIGYPERLPSSGKALIDVSALLDPESRCDAQLLENGTDAAHSWFRAHSA